MPVANSNPSSNASNAYDTAFTYGTYPAAPQNEATDYVDPAKYAEITSRFTDITAEIAFAGKALTGAGGILRAISKFNTTLYDDDFSSNSINPSRKAYNAVPLITCNLTKHTFTFSAIEAMNPLTLTTNTPHGIYSSQRFEFQNVVSDNAGLQTNLNNQNFYVKKIDNNTVELYNDQALTSPVDANAWLTAPDGYVTKHYAGLNVSLVTATAVLNSNGTHTPSFRINTSTAHGVVNGALMAASGFTYYAFLNGNNYYVKTFDGYPTLLQLYLDADLTIPLDVTDYAPEYDLTSISGAGSFTVNVSVADVADTAPAADANSRQLRITTDAPHNLIAGVHDAVPAMPMVFTSSNFINFGSTVYHVKVVDNNTIDLFLDDALTVPARLADMTFNKSGAVASADAITITWNGILASNPLKLSSAADVSYFNGREVTFGTNDLGLSTTTTYYIKAIGTNAGEIYTDAALTVPFTIANVGLDTYGNTTIASNGDYPEYLSLNAYNTFTITTSTGSVAVDATGASFRATHAITDPVGSYRVFYMSAPTGTDPTTVDHTANKWASAQRIRAFTQTSPYPTYDCFTRVDWSPYTYNLGNGQTGYVYIIRFYSNRSLTTNFTIASYNAIQSATYNRYYVTSYSSLNGLKFRVIAKSASTNAGPWVSVTTSGSAKFLDGITPGTGYASRTGAIYNSTAHTEVNGYPYYNKATLLIESHTESNASMTYDVESFLDLDRTIPVGIAAIPDTIVATAGTLITTISNLAHRTLRYVPIVDTFATIQSGQRYTFSAAYKSAINGTHYVKVIRTFTYTGKTPVTLVELYSDAGLTTLIDTSVVENAVDNTVYIYPFSSKVYSNLYYPKVTENATFTFRDGLRLAFAGSHIPYINGNSYYVKERIEASSNDDVDIGRHRLDFYTDIDMTILVDLKALAFAGTIPKLDFVSQAFDGGHKVLSFNSATPCVVKTNSIWHYNTGDSVYMTGGLSRNFENTTLYVKYLSTDASGSYYELYTNAGLTTGATYDPTAFSYTMSGNTQPSANEAYPWKVASLNKYLKGTRWFRRYNSTLNSGIGGYEFAPKAIQFAARDGIVTGWGDYPGFTYTKHSGDVYSIGDISFDPADPGKFTINAEVAIIFGTEPDVGAPAGSVVDIEAGLFNTHDAWTTPSYVPGGKFWPTHVLPNSATIRVEQPTRVTTSQNQQRYTRTNGSIRYNIELTYPPMKKEDFNLFRAAIEGMQGQWNVCELPIGIITADENQVNSWCNLFNDVDPGETTGLLPAGSTVLAFEGLQANQDVAIIAGQFIKILDTEGFPNGGLAVALHDSPSNSWGESKVRITHPTRKAIWAYTGAHMKPDTIAVSLNSDTTEYNISTANYYSLKVSFICTGWA
jgi:hypothetical protein